MADPAGRLRHPSSAGATDDTPPTIAGIVSLAPPGILSVSFIALFTSGVADQKTAAQQADAIATLLDAWTKTVMVINTPIAPPGPPLPPAPLA